MAKQGKYTSEQRSKNGCEAQGHYSHRRPATQNCHQATKRRENTCARVRLTSEGCEFRAGWELTCSIGCTGPSAVTAAQSASIFLLHELEEMKWSRNYCFAKRPSLAGLLCQQRGRGRRRRSNATADVHQRKVSWRVSTRALGQSFSNFMAIGGPRRTIWRVVSKDQTQLS